jgi:NADH dehydrogenase/NADH:ubiquinone oxidoreductase subunit G
MKMSLAILAISGTLTWFCSAQDYGSSPVIKQSAPDNAKQRVPNANQAADYATPTQREIEANAQFELLSRLAQEHRKRADELSSDQAARARWESDLVKELSDKASATLALITNISQERLALIAAHPDLVAGANNSPSNGRNPDEIAFLAKLEERLASVQQEIADALEAGKLYTAQLLTNTASYDFSRMSSVLQDNGNTLKQLQKEEWDLELKKLEFRALRSR